MEKYIKITPPHSWVWASKIPKSSYYFVDGEGLTIMVPEYIYNSHLLEVEEHLKRLKDGVTNTST